jgi:hypothetical protein
MGAVTVAPDSPYAKLMAPVERAKVATATDSWIGNVPTTKIRTRVDELADLIVDELPDTGVDRTSFRKYLEQTVLAHHMGLVLQPLWVRSFKNLSLPEIDQVMASFSLANCRRNEGLLQVLRRHMRP